MTHGSPLISMFPLSPPPQRQDALYARRQFNFGGNRLLRELMKRCAGFTSYVRGSQLAMALLARLCKEMGVALRRPQSPVDTRWDSEYRMLCVIFWLRVVLQAAWSNQADYGNALPIKSKSGKTIYALRPTDWTTLEQAVLVLGRLERTRRR